MSKRDVSAQIKKVLKELTDHLANKNIESILQCFHPSGIFSPHPRAPAFLGRAEIRNFLRQQVYKLSLAKSSVKKVTVTGPERGSAVLTLEDDKGSMTFQVIVSSAPSHGYVISHCILDLTNEEPIRKAS